MAKNNNLQDFIQDLGDTIRKKKGTTAKINPQNFSSEIESIETATAPTLQSKSVTPSTSQQMVQPDAGYDGLSDVTVNAVTNSIDANIKASNIKDGISILGVTGTLQEGITPEGTLEITENNTYDVTNYAWASVNVEADLNERVIIGKWVDGGIFVYEFKENGIFLLNGFEGTYTILGNTIQARMMIEEPDIEPQTIIIIFTYNRDADTLVMVGDDGIEYVSTRVPTTLITKEITENGTYKASDDGADGYSEVVVNVGGSGGSSGGYPIEATTDQEMTNALTQDNLGKVYKFTGTSDTYETDGIYIVSEVE